MEQARCLMMAKQAQNFVDDDSWEERAFAEDAAGMLGGCVWPPRSYTCSFCGREFRSAQALGGHMNVHRRDRAKLKQLSCSHNQILNNPNLLSYSYLTFTNPTSHQTQDSSSFISNSPNLDSTQLVSSQDINGSKQSLFPPSELNRKRKHSLSTYDLGIVSNNNNKEIDHNNENYLEKPSSFVCLDLGKNGVTMVDRYEEDEFNNHKRRKVDVPSSQPCMSKPIDKGKVDYHSSKVDTDLKSNSIEELDLELRLGV